MLKNQIELPGVSNARELGGYPVEGGRVRKGVLLRTGYLGEASPEAISILQDKYKVKTIVDFRMSGEVYKAPNKEVPGAKYVHLPVMEMEDYAARIKDPNLLKEFMSGKLDRGAIFDIAYENGMLGPEMYELFLQGDRGKAAYREFFKILLNTDPDKEAVLWHCKDGKDRTGIGAALILSLLGATRDTIFEDFLLTNEYNAVVVKAAWEKYSATGMDQDRLDALLFTTGGVIKRYLDYALNVLDKEYGGVEGYLTGPLGLTKEDLKELREKYTD